MEQNKGILINEFAEVNQKIIDAQIEMKKLVAYKETIEELIAVDKDLGEMLANDGAISTSLGNKMVTLNKATCKLEVKSCVPSYTIAFLLTDNQKEVLENGQK